MKLRVLSLFDGISCGYQALENLGIEIETYYASEIESTAMLCARTNHPNIVHIGDVTKVDFTKYRGKVDIVIAGSPCQNFSILGDRKGLNGLKSRLFSYVPKAIEETGVKLFLLENVCGMNKETKAYIDSVMGVTGRFINSSSFSAQNRKRFYWYPGNDVELPTSSPVIKDIMTDEKHIVGTIEDIKDLLSKPGNKWFKLSWQHGLWDINGKSGCLVTTTPRIYEIHQSGAWAINPNEFWLPTRTECERLQGLPDGYTSMLSKTAAFKALGNGWQVDTIMAILSTMLK